MCCGEALSAFDHAQCSNCRSTQSGVHGHATGSRGGDAGIDIGRVAQNCVRKAPSGSIMCASSASTTLSLRVGTLSCSRLGALDRYILYDSGYYMYMHPADQTLLLTLLSHYCCCSHTTLTLLSHRSLTARTLLSHCFDTTLTLLLLLFRRPCSTRCRMAVAV